MVTHLRLLLHGLQAHLVRVEVVAPESFDPEAIGGVSGETPPQYVWVDTGPDDDGGEEHAAFDRLTDIEEDELLDGLNLDAEIDTQETWSYIPVYPEPIRAKPHPLYDFVAARRIAKAAKSEHYDVLHGHGLRGAWIAALAAQRCRTPFIFTAHNVAPLTSNPLTKLLLKFVVRHAAKVICISKAVAKSLEPYGLNETKTALIPNGIDLAPFDIPRQPILPTFDEPRIVAVGRLSPEKGFDTLIQAAKIVLETLPRANITIVGDGPERENLSQQIKSMGIEEKVMLAGRVEDIPSFLHAADLVVIPSLSEGQGIVALEAMAARKPIVASRVGGLIETVEEGVTGLLVAPRDPRELADGIIRLLKSPEQAAGFGEAGRAKVASDYTVETMVERTLDVYRTVADR